MLAQWDPLYLNRYFPELTSQQQAALALWAQELKAWNERINLVSRKDIEALQTHHLLPSLSYLKLDVLRPGMRLLDLGTGGGLPGLPLAIARPDIQFILVDSIAKKAQAVQAMANTLGIQNVQVLCARAETLQFSVDFVIGRAVASFDKLMQWTQPLLPPGPTSGPLQRGLLYMKGSRYRDELKGVSGVKAWDLQALFPQAEWAQGRFMVHLPSRAFLNRVG